MSTYPDDEDGAVLAAIAAQGVDMTQPLLIEFAVAVPNEAAAGQVQQAITDAGYEAVVEFDEGEPDEEEDELDDEEFGPLWTVVTNVEMIPEHAEIVRIQADLDRIAGPLGGNSDGWGVMIEAPPDDE